MSCKNYIARLLRSHGWESKEEEDPQLLVNPSMAAVAALNLLETAIKNEDYSDTPKFTLLPLKLLEATKNILST